MGIPENVVPMRKDCLIVGGGFAGLTLALSCAQAGLTYDLFQESIPGEASTVSAGVLNPAAGKRFSLAWRGREMLDAAFGFYRTWLGAMNLFQELPLIRLFENGDSKNLWAKAVKRGTAPREYTPLAEFSREAGTLPGDWEGVVIKGSAVLMAEKAIVALNTLVGERGNLLPGTFDHAALHPEGLAWKYGDTIYDRVVFAEGVRVQNNPWFQFLPLSPLKGQALVLASQVLKDFPRLLLHGHHWLVPLNNGNWYFGSTREKEFRDPHADSQGREELLHGFVRLFGYVPREDHIFDQPSGVRPVSHDRYPYLGEHPDVRGIYCFNGLGSKGVLMAPWCAQQLVRHFTEGQKLPLETDLRRCRRLEERKKSQATLETSVAERWIRRLDLSPHPEGGFYKRIYTSSLEVTHGDNPSRKRPAITAIHYLLKKGQYSAFHRIQSDELWHHTSGAPLRLFLLKPDGSAESLVLGNHVEKGQEPLIAIPAGVWFAARPEAGPDFVLCTCTVAPGFDFSDFELADEATLYASHPEQEEWIKELCLKP